MIFIQKLFLCTFAGAMQVLCGPGSVLFLAKKHWTKRAPASCWTFLPRICTTLAARLFKPLAGRDALPEPPLEAAKIKIKLELFSSAVYHGQKQPIAKTHDVIQLLEQCMVFDQEFREKFDST